MGEWSNTINTLIHEMTHAALPADEWHGDKFKSLMVDAMRELMSEVE